MSDKKESLDPLKAIENLQETVDRYRVDIDQLETKVADLVGQSHPSAKEFKGLQNQVDRKVSLLKKINRSDTFRNVVAIVVFTLLIVLQGLLIWQAKCWSDKVAQGWSSTTGKQQNEAFISQSEFASDLNTNDQKAGLTPVDSTASLGAKRFSSTVSLDQANNLSGGIAIIIVHVLVFLACFLSTLWVLYQYVVAWPKIKPIDEQAVFDEIQHLTQEKVKGISVEVKDLKDLLDKHTKSIKELNKPTAKQQLDQLLEVIKTTRTKTVTEEGKNKVTTEEVNTEVMKSLGEAIGNLFNKEE